MWTANDNHSGVSSSSSEEASSASSGAPLKNASYMAASPWLVINVHSSYNASPV